MIVKLKFQGLGSTHAMMLARRALTALAIVVALGGFSYAILSGRGAAKHEHMIKCLSAYIAFLQVVGPEAEGIERLKSCEHSPDGEEPIHLEPREPKYEACLAAHLLMSSDLDKSLEQQRESCRY
jgi:hypothetical protein